MRLSMLTAAIFVALVAATVLAGETEDVVIAGQVAFRIKDPGSFGSLSGRITDVDQRVCEAISSEDVGNPKMKVAQRQGLWAVFIGKTYLVSVLPLDAKMYGKPAKALAATWSQRLKELLPLAQPMTAIRNTSAVTAMDRRAAQAALMRRVKVPQQQWGIVARYMIDLWDARQVKEEERAVEDVRLTARMVEDGAKYYYATPEAKPFSATAGGEKGHEPGTCTHMKTCDVCQAMMDGSIDAPESKRAVSSELAKMLAADEEMSRAFRQAQEYVRFIKPDRFMRERVRVAWELWQRLEKRAKALQASAEAAVAEAAVAAAAAAAAPAAPTAPETPPSAPPTPGATPETPPSAPPAPGATPMEKPGG